MQANRKTGFTLIEISLVLVVIGLVVGGVMVGKDLIKAAERRAQLTQIETFQVAITTFKLKYNQLAGDANNASQFFTGVTDGNGNGILQLADGTSVYTVGHFGGEIEQFFIHLSQANLVDGNYTGGAVLDIGYPALKMRPGMGMFAGTSTNKRYVSLLMRITNPASMPNLNNADDVYSYSKVLTGEDTMFLDSKIDDGKPAAGKFRANTEASFVAPVSPCNDGTSYFSNVETSRCRPWYDLQF